MLAGYEYINIVIIMADLGKWAAAYQYWEIIENADIYIYKYIYMFP